MASVVPPPAAADADAVYKYRNEKGVTVFADAPPPHTSDFERIRLPAVAPTDLGQHESTLEQIIATSNRLRSDRLQREKARKPVRPVAFPTERRSASDPERYLIPGYPFYRHRFQPQRPQPPYRIENRRDTLDAKLRTPIPIPSFGEDAVPRRR